MMSYGVEFIPHAGPARLQATHVLCGSGQRCCQASAPRAERGGKGTGSGYGSKLNQQGTADCVCLRLPGFHVGHLFLTHSQLAFSSGKDRPVPLFGETRLHRKGCSVAVQVENSQHAGVTLQHRCHWFPNSSNDYQIPFFPQGQVLIVPKSKRHKHLRRNHWAPGYLRACPVRLSGV